MLLALGDLLEKIDNVGKPLKWNSPTLTVSNEEGLPLDISW